MASSASWSTADYLDDKYKNHHQDIVGWKGNTLPCSSFAANFTTVRQYRLRDSGHRGDRQPAPCRSWYPQDMAMYLEYIDSQTQGRAGVGPVPSDRMPCW